MICLYIKCRISWNYCWNIWLPHFVLSWFLFHGMVRNGILRVYFYFLLHEKEFRVVFSSAEWFGMEFWEFASILVLRNGIPSCVLFPRRVWNRTKGVCFYFCSTKRNSVLFSLLRKGSERNIEIFCLRNNRNSVRNNHLFRLFRLLRNYFFLRKFPTLVLLYFFNRVYNTLSPTWCVFFSAAERVDFSL